MKRIIFLAEVFCLFAVLLVLAQNEAFAISKEVPAKVKDAFNAKYPNTKVIDWDWEEDKNMYEAEFKMDGREWEAYFAPDGAWEYTKTDITKSKLPAAVSSAVASGEYGSWNMEDFKEMDTPAYGKVYKMKVEKGREELFLMFDGNGKMVEQEVAKPRRMTKK